MCKVSVIVPVYNLKQYIPRCIDSLQSQTLEDIEIIIIDDGSTDGSAEICDQYADEDSRIRVLHKKNEGLSAARNVGVRMARANYIMFADGDDWVEPEFCELPYRAATENNVEVVCFQHTIVFSNGKRTKSRLMGEGLLAKGDISTLKAVGAYVWSKLYRKSIFDTIQYPVGHMYEDIATTHRILYFANGVYLLNNCLYNYCVNRAGSLTETANPENQRDHFWALSLRSRDFANWGVDTSDELRSAALSNLIKYGRRTDLSNNWDAVLSQTKCMPKDTSWKNRIAFALYRINPLLFDIACILTKKRRT